jgi:hypothetical protein
VSSADSDGAGRELGRSTRSLAAQVRGISACAGATRGTRQWPGKKSSEATAGWFFGLGLRGCFSLGLLQIHRSFGRVSVRRSPLVNRPRFKLKNHLPEPRHSPVIYLSNTLPCVASQPKPSRCPKSRRSSSPTTT